MAGFHKGKLPEELSCFECDAPSLFVSCIKKAEDSDKLVFRLYEPQGKDVDATVKLFDNTLKLSVPHNALRTFNENGDEMNILEME